MLEGGSNHGYNQLKRGRGKTSYLIIRSLLTGKRILCVNFKHRQFIKHLAERMGIIFLREPLMLLKNYTVAGVGKIKEMRYL